MHVRVRFSDKPEAIVVVDSKLTKIEKFRQLIKDKFGVSVELQRLFYGGKVLENGYSFHDYNIKLNDVIQLMVKIVPKTENDSSSSSTDKCTEASNNSVATEKEIKYEDAKSNLYEIDDLVDVRDREHGAWFEAKITQIVRDPTYKPDKLNNSPIKSPKTNGYNNSCNGASGSNTSVNSENNDTPKKEPKKRNSKTRSPKTPQQQRGIADYFSKTPKNSKKNDDESPGKKDDGKTDVGILYKVSFDNEDDDGTPKYCTLNEIRPRARKEISVDDLVIGQRIMVNYNTEDHHERGYWYDFTLAEIKQLRKSVELTGTLYLGAEGIPQNDTRVKCHEKIYAIEKVVPLRERTKDYNKLMKTPMEKRAAPLNCTTCRDDTDTPCKDCGCFLCSGKQQPEKIILCDECNNGYHMFCLVPELTDLPEEDWYCPSCKRDPNDVVAPGAAKQAKKANQTKSKRDWGRGMACVGKTQTCAMPPNHFGPIPGVEVGMVWRFRIQLSESGVHRPPVSGIHGRDTDGAYSLVLSGGYEDDVDNGVEFTYTGSGGRDLSGNKRTADQSSDQTLTRENKALARNCAVKEVTESGADAGEKWRDGKPVRVVRSYKMLKHFPEYAPAEGIRYDGIYKVVKYYPETGKSGFRVWKYLLRRDDPNPAPWEKNCKTFTIIYPDGYLEAEAEKKAQKEKELSKKNSNQGTKNKKQVLKESNSMNKDNKEDIQKKRKLDKSINESPPQKKRRTRGSKAPNSPDEKVETPKRGKGKDANTSLQSPSPKNNKNPFTIAAQKSKTKGETETSPNNKKTKRSSPLTEEEMEIIKKDTLNAKLWEECLVTCSEKGKQQFIQKVTQLFLCIICQEVAANPVTTKCQHNFCMSCLKLAFKSTDSQSCSYCRQNLSQDDLEYNEELKLALRTLMPGYDIGKK